MSALTIAIASDLHAFDDPQGKEDPSYLSVALPDNEPGKHPIAGLLKLIKEQALSANMLLCPGDIGDKARPVAIKAAWAYLEELRTALNAQQLAVTTGNHDYDSRYAYNGYDAKGVLQGLVPPYPLPDDSDNDKYWARNFVITEGHEHRLVILNSSAFHGTAPEEIEHGRVSDATLERIKTALTGLPEKPVNILLCHHHPIVQSELGLGETDTMKNGQQLMNLLASGNFGSWIVVHGHKHHAKLTYAEGGGAAPVVFSAGSLCAILKAPLSSVVKNQFYLMQIPTDLIDRYGLVGTIRSWEWAPGRGWLTSAARSQLPPLCGFGFRTNPTLFAASVAALVVGDRTSWADIRKKMPEIDYLIPKDMDVVQMRLRDAHQLDIVEDRNGTVREIGRVS